MSTTEEAFFVLFVFAVILAGVYKIMYKKDNE